MPPKVLPKLKLKMFTCECGAVIKPECNLNHLKTKYHNDFIMLFPDIKD